MGKRQTQAAVLAGLAAVALVVVATTGVATRDSRTRAATPTTTEAAPTGVVAQQAPYGNTINVRWTPSGPATPTTGAVVQLYDGTTYVGYVTCRAGCSAAVFRGLVYGHRYAALMFPANGASVGHPTASNAVTLQNTCNGAAACLTVDATGTAHPVRHAALGFLNSFQPVGTLLAQATAWHPVSWRGEPNYQPATGTYDWSAWNKVATTGAKMDLILSAMWYEETNHGQGAAPPWSNWSGYSAWVAATVQRVEATQHVDYWEIQNEPGGDNYYSSANWNNITPEMLLQQFLVAYRAIKSVDPNAQIIGPSLQHFADYPGEYTAHEVDLVTFLNFAVSNNMKLAGLTWHEIDDVAGPNPADFGYLPQNIEDHLTEARRLIAQRPSLGAVPILINEYGHRMESAIPGSSVGYLAALENGRVDEANRSCWPDQTPQGVVYTDCWTPTLDSLFGLDGSSHRANYWVYKTYADMAGANVPVSYSDDTITGLAARSDGTRTVSALVGRHLTCLGGTNKNCQEPPSWTPAPTSVSVSVKLPWAVSTATVNVSQIPATWELVPAPTVVFAGPVKVTNGVATVPLPSVADGDAYSIAVTAA